MAGQDNSSCRQRKRQYQLELDNEITIRRNRERILALADFSDSEALFVEQANSTLHSTEITFGVIKSIQRDGSSYADVRARLGPRTEETEVKLRYMDQFPDIVLDVIDNMGSIPIIPTADEVEFQHQPIVAPTGMFPIGDVRNPDMDAAAIEQAFNAADDDDGTKSNVVYEKVLNLSKYFVTSNSGLRNHRYATFDGCKQSPFLRFDDKDVKPDCTAGQNRQDQVRLCSSNRERVQFHHWMDRGARIQATTLLSERMLLKPLLDNLNPHVTILTFTQPTSGSRIRIVQICQPDVTTFIRQELRDNYWRKTTFIFESDRTR